ncbi:MAG: alpha-L-rhamnosidase N-terminal domain-containing protein, partial [Acidobacteria bacterium]|nr:alpha-L-rhamnosidase N-terminal domain-containing protein [Acidobacteriota bacterium]
MRFHRLCSFVLTAASLPCASLIPERLQCEGQDNPIAVESARPGLGWLLRATSPSARGLKQTGYQIRVASSAETLAKDRADLWNSGKVSSDLTYQIAYQGKAGAAYWWKVRVWDAGGKASAWSAAAEWRAAPGDWGAARWIAGAADGERMPVFQKSFRITKPVRRALVYVSGLGQYELSLNGKKVGDAVLAPGWTNYRKTVYYNAYDVTARLKPGANVAGVMLGNGMYNVPKTPGRYTKFTGSMGEPKMIARVRVEYRDGSADEILSDGTWQTAAGPVVYSHTFGGEDFDARLKPEQWQAAREVEGPGGRLTAQQNPEIKVMRTYRTVKVTEPKPGTRVYDLGQNFSGWPRIR